MMWAESGEEEKEPELHMSSSGEQRKHMTSIFCICKNQTLFNNSSAPATFAERRSHLVIQSQCPFGSPIALMTRVTRERVELLLTSQVLSTWNSNSIKKPMQSLAQGTSTLSVY